MTAPNTDPGAPAPAVAPAAPTPTPSLVPLSSVEQASQSARERLASTGTAEPAPPHHSEGQPRIGEGHPKGGEFVKSQIKEIGANIPTGEADGQAAPEAAGAPQGEQAAGEAPDGQAGEEGAETGSEGEGEASNVVTIPGRNPGEEVDIEIDDPEVADRLRQLSNSAMRGDEAREFVSEATRARQEVAEFEEMLAADPGGVTLRAMRDDPETLEHLALYLATRPEIAERIKDRITDAYNDPDKFENLSLRMEVERRSLSDNFQTVAQERRAWQDNAQQVRQAVTSIIPPGMAAPQVEVFFRDALRDIVEYCQANNMLTLNPQYVPLILAPRMTANGIDPVLAAKRLAEGARGAGNNRNSGNGTAGTRPASNGAGAPPMAPQRTGAQMVAGAARRRVAAQVPGAGAGTGGPAPVIPPYDPTKGTSHIEQATAAHRAALAATRSGA